MMFKKLFFILSICLLVLFGCEIKYPPESEYVTPEISYLVFSDTLYLNSDALYPVKVKVEDPQGTEDIDVVDMRITDLDSTEIFYADTLKDNGSAGDVIPADGEYYSVIPTDFTDNEGIFLLHLQAVDISGNSAIPVQDTLMVIEGEFNLPPVISDPQLPDSLDSKSIQNVFFSITADDPQGLADIDSVYLWIYPPLKSAPVFKGRLKDDGTGGDVTAGDRIFSLRQDLSQILGSSGINLVRFQAVDKKGEKSEPIVCEIFITIPNAPPSLSNLTAPDTLSRNTSQSSLLSVEVCDPQGPGDINIVFFNSFRPDGTASLSNPVLMNDNGDNGDITPDDGVYSCGISINSSVLLGNWRFEFMARDNAQAMSDTLIHIMTIVN
ncbi:MAG: hypothetical protein R6V04_14740 [bacterium]